MSAIFGILGPTSASNGVDALQSSFTTKYECDRSAIWFNETCGLGTLEQWINKEEEHSPQPFQLDSFIIVFDGMLDYRDDLKEKLNVSHNERTTDVELVARSFMKWGIDCVEHLMGIFAFAVYDESIDEMWIVRDRLGERAVCYTHREDGLMFSTTPKPIATYYDYDINETFLKQYAVSPMQLKTHDPYIAPWEKIRYVPPGHILHCQQGKVTLKEYWKYQSLPERTFSSEEECHKELDKILEEATRACARTDGEVGLMLSGGLDSTTVAAYAAPLLKREDKSLHAYTHVPLSEYEDSAEVLGNERPLVEEVLKYYPSIKPNWIENRERNAYNTMNDWVEILEMPYIFFGNAPWMLTIYEEAQKSHVKIMLNGKHGNFTISYGSIGVYYSELFRNAQISKLVKEFLVQLKINQKIYTALKRTLRPILLSYRNKNKSEQFFKEYAHIFFSTDLQKDINYDHLNIDESNVVKRLEDICQADNLHLRGIISTMCSLNFQCIIRDPLSDINLINFCSRLPSEHFASKGISKKLVRTLMTHRLPSQVLDMNRPRGRQSADWSNRLEGEREHVMGDLKEAQFDLFLQYPTNQLWNQLLRDVWTMIFVFRIITIQKFKGGERV